MDCRVASLLAMTGVNLPRHGKPKAAIVANQSIERALQATGS